MRNSVFLKATRETFPKQSIFWFFWLTINWKLVILFMSADKFEIKLVELRHIYQSGILAMTYLFILPLLITVFAYYLMDFFWQTIVDKESKNPVLLDLCKEGKLDKVKQLIQQGTAVNTQDSKGITALHYACGHGYTEIVEMLLNSGADISLKDKAHRTALDWVDDDKKAEFRKIFFAYKDKTAE